jgi:hypothetical protein
LPTNTSTVIHERHARRPFSHITRSPSTAPTSATANREAPVLNVALSQRTIRAAAMSCGLKDRGGSPRTPGLGRQHHVVALANAPTPAPGSPRCGRTSTRYTRSTAGKISVEARRITSRDIHCKATTPAGLTARTVPALWKSPSAGLARELTRLPLNTETPAASRRRYP